MKGMVLDPASAAMRRISIFGPAEVDQQTQELTCCPQVVPALRAMHAAQRADHLEFDDDLVLDQETGGIFANDYVVVKGDDSKLPDGAESSLSHLEGKGIFGKLFNEPMTERMGNPERTSDDPLGHRLQQPRIPFIRLTNLPWRPCRGLTGRECLMPQVLTNHEPLWTAGSPWARLFSPGGSLVPRGRSRRRGHGSHAARPR
jgi:hypothetical protein